MSVNLRAGFYALGVAAGVSGLLILALAALALIGRWFGPLGLGAAAFLIVAGVVFVEAFKWRRDELREEAEESP